MNQTKNIINSSRDCNLLYICTVTVNTRYLRTEHSCKIHRFICELLPLISRLQIDLVNLVPEPETRTQNTKHLDERKAL